jgi:hypothetical protein
MKRILLPVLAALAVAQGTLVAIEPSDLIGTWVHSRLEVGGNVVEDETLKSAEME